MIVRNLPSGPLMVNTYLVVDEATKKGFLVDPGGYDLNTVELIEREEISLEYVVLTHGHGDHIGGVPKYLEKYPKARLVSAKAERGMLEDPHVNMSIMTCREAISLTADIEVGEGDTLFVGNMELKFIMTPGHTVGGMCILLEDVLFSGDTLFHASIGRTDFPGGSFEELVKGIHEKLFVLPEETKVYPGHMGETTIGFEKRNNPFV